jgi:RHS repeat-associated protein
VHTDHLNTPRKVTQPSDNQARWTWESAPFGTEPPTEDPVLLGAFSYNLRFPGQIYDAHTGLNYNYFRDYDAAIGRYIESDPIGLEGGINTYLYAGGNAIGNVDPLGLQYLGAKPPPNVGGPWTWMPDPANNRGGLWRDASGKSANWDPSGHWDVWGQDGRRQRFDRWGNETDLHRNPFRRGSDKPIVNWGKKVCRVLGPASMAVTIGIALSSEERLSAEELAADLLCDLTWGCSAAE